MIVGAVSPKAMLLALYSNPVRVCSPLATTGKVISTVSVLPAASETVTVAVAVDASAVSGAPVISPVLGLRVRPEGSPGAA